jgi:hypothetical protein
VALALSVPFAIHAATTLAGAPGGIAKTGAGIALAAVLSAVVAFVEVPPTRATGWWAEVVAGCIITEVGLRQLYATSPAGSGPLDHVLTAAALVVAASPIGLGLFQVLATIYAPDARRVDVHKPA